MDMHGLYEDTLTSDELNDDGDVEVGRVYDEKKSVGTKRVGCVTLQ